MKSRQGGSIQCGANRIPWRGEEKQLWRCRQASLESRDVEIQRLGHRDFGDCSARGKRLDLVQTEAGSYGDSLRAGDNKGTRNRSDQFLGAIADDQLVKAAPVRILSAVRSARQAGSE